MSNSTPHLFRLVRKSWPHAVLILAGGFGGMYYRETAEPLVVSVILVLSLALVLTGVAIVQTVLDFAKIPEANDE